ncbi:hypothetical protein RN001_015355 [Aquatica leii]|uniref:AB hydrolase-1 domain-containing protein n=1 Tax=Aquatica leii TaxID=1421715 RepID=A0AAN7P0Z2_9COLE|nr:hypothetical protein RN001_015355 [Aquatica leii]
MVNKRRSVVDSIPSSKCYNDYDYEPYSSQEDLSCCQRHRCYFITVTFILLLLVLIFIIVFVVLPVTFMLSADVQRSLIFLTSQSNEEYDFTNFKKYGIEGVRNLYVTLNHNISVGIWHVLPLEYTYPAVEDDDFDYAEILRESRYPVLLYFRDSGENRITSKNKYLVFRRFFHVFTFDYRCFGDSSQGLLTEDGIVNDAVQLYKWLRLQTPRPIYFWGHTLGAALASKTARQLRKELIVPTGLFLESPFTNLEDAVLNFPFVWVFSWLPWFKGTVTNPLKQNGFWFQTDEYMLSVDCPIMMIHAKDDSYVPFTFSTKLLEISNEMRIDRDQGNATLYLFSKYLRYGHNDLYQASELPDYIRKHISICNYYELGRG